MDRSELIQTDMMRTASASTSQVSADAMIRRFLVWAEISDLKSYDWWDLWGFPFGRWAKTQYVRGNVLGYGAVAFLTAVDLVAPWIRRFFVEQRTFPICHAQMALGYVQLWKSTGNRLWLEKAEALVEPLLAMASPAAHGLGWGMKHEWTTVRGVIPPDTPCNTQTAYPYELFCALYEATGNERYQKILADIAAHVANDFREWHMDDRLACSYSTIDEARVVNANSYRMMMMLEAGKRFTNTMYHEKGLATLRYVLSMQRDDGSWPYAEDQDFVDTYHTCFVLKNLRKAATILEGDCPDVEQAVARGLEYFNSRHFDRNGYPLPFSVAPRLVLQRYDAYDLAETISLLSSLEGEEKRVAHLLEFAQQWFQTAEGWFIFRVYAGNLIRGIPYMRYANSAMFLALSTIPVSSTTPRTNDPDH